MPSRSSSPSDPISTTRPPASRERTRSSRLSRSDGGRSAAITTWRPASISAFRVWQNSAWVDLALQELQIVDHQHVDAAQRFLEGQRGLRLQRGDEAVHEFLGGEIQHLALAAGIAGPGHRLQQMGLAEADAGMDVERVEHHAVAAAAFGDLARGGMRQRVGAADHEASEGQARIERRAAERVMAGGYRRGRGGAQFGRGAAVGPLGAARSSAARRFLGGRRAAHRGAHGEIDAVHFRHLGLPAGQHALGVMRLDPALQKPRRHRQVHAFLLHAFQVHAREPARIDVFADARAQPALHA